MKCKDTDRHIDDYLDKQLNPDDRFAFEQHISKCESCAQKVEFASSLLSGLSDLPVPEPSANFEHRVFTEVRRQHREHQQQHHGFRFATGFATAAVASLAIWFVSSVYITPDPLVEQAQVVSVAMNEAQTVRLMFDSQVDIEQVTLSIGLPDNMQLAGYPGHKELTWQTSLQKGQNILALPVKAVGYGQGELLAKLNYGDKVKIFRVVLKTTVDGVQLYELEDAKSA